MQLVGKPDDEFLSKISSESVNIFFTFFSTLLQMPILIIALAVCSETIVDLILLIIIMIIIVIIIVIIMLLE